MMMLVVGGDDDACVVLCCVVLYCTVLYCIALKATVGQTLIMTGVTYIVSDPALLS